MLGSSIKLSLLSRRTSKVELREIPRVKNSYKKSENGRFDSILTRALHIRRHVTSRRPIGIKRKRSSKYSTAHGLSTGTNYIWLTSLDIILPYSY